VHKRLREHDYVRSFAGDEDGNALVRSWLAARGEITAAELSVPTEDVREKETFARAEITASHPRLQQWKVVGYYKSEESADFLRAAAEHYQQSIVVLELKNKKYTSMHEYYYVDGLDGAVTLDTVTDQVNESIVLERKGTQFSAFLCAPRPTTKAEAIATHSRGYGVCHDRSKYIKAARKAGVVTQQTTRFPRDCEYVPVTYAHTHLDGVAKQMLDLLDLTFREECERRETRGELTPRSCVLFEDKHAGAHGMFVRKDILEERNAWAAIVTKEVVGMPGVTGLDVRREIRSQQGGRIVNDMTKMKQLWDAGILRCRESGVLTFDPTIDDPEYQEKVKEWKTLTEKLHKASVKQQGRKRPREDS